MKAFRLLYLKPLKIDLGVGGRFQGKGKCLRLFIKHKVRHDYSNFFWLDNWHLDGVLYSKYDLWG